MSISHEQKTIINSAKTVDFEIGSEAWTSNHITIDMGGSSNSVKFYNVDQYNNITDIPVKRLDTYIDVINSSPLTGTSIYECVVLSDNVFILRVVGQGTVTGTITLTRRSRNV